MPRRGSSLTVNHQHRYWRPRFWPRHTGTSVLGDPERTAGLRELTAPGNSTGIRPSGAELAGAGCAPEARRHPMPQQGSPTVMTSSQALCLTERGALHGNIPPAPARSSTRCTRRPGRDGPESIGPAATARSLLSLLGSPGWEGRWLPDGPDVRDWRRPECASGRRLAEPHPERPRYRAEQRRGRPSCVLSFRAPDPLGRFVPAPRHDHGEAQIAVL
jgi:hypothetical protein